MSGSGNKRSKTQSQGWEEAGAEFYQESFPIDGDLDLPRDPKYLATLLPSKQNRAATIRIRTHDNRTQTRTMRRHQQTTTTRSRRESTVHRRPSGGGEVQVSMLPDLSEMDANERTTYEEIMQIKSLPLSMEQKREMKAKILNQPNLRLQGYEQFKWKRRKMWGQVHSRVTETLSKMQLWRGALKHIEGHFGTGVVAYFLFIKWMFLLNLFIFLVIFLFITLPTILLSDENCDSFAADMIGCSNITFNALDLVQGTGIMQNTLLFYGFYSNETYSYEINNTQMYYNMPLAYLCVTLIFFGVSLVAIVRAAAKGFKERLIEGEGQYYKYSNMIFSGWDFCVQNEKSAKIKHKAIFSEIKATLETVKEEEEKQSRTRNERYKIVLSRIIVNILVIAVLGTGACAIYFVFNFSTFALNDAEPGKPIYFFYQFLPSMCIVALNMVVPMLFKFLISFEQYNPLLVIRYTLMRTVFLRLASLIVLYGSLYLKITCDSSDQGSKCSDLPCWETYVGQNIYKLLITDFATHLVITFLVNFPRALLADHCESKFFKLIGYQSFELPKHVLDVVYSQTLCWSGFFFAPMLSAMASIAFMLLFYIKKFACLVNSKPSAIIYRASRSNSMFMVILLISYTFAIIPITFSIAELEPSKSCGPFRYQSTVWSLIVDSFMSTPQFIQDIVFFLGTAGFAIPVAIILILLIYYYTAIISANRQMVNVLKNQLILEGHDKQFLLDRLSMFIRQQEQIQKREMQRHTDLRQDSSELTNLSSN